jgi:hypothetical protein
LEAGRLEVDRPAVLLQQIGEGLVGQLLEVPHACLFGKSLIS